MEILKKNRGFTLTELIIVIVILGILTFVAFIKWSETTTALDVQTSTLASDIRYTQDLSVSRNERCQFVITSATSYVIRDSNGVNQQIPSTGNVNGVFLPDTYISSPVPYTLIFDGRGTPYNGATSPPTKLSSNLVITLNNTRGQLRTITITHVTGKVTF